MCFFPADQNQGALWRKTGGCVPLQARVGAPPLGVPPFLHRMGCCHAKAVTAGSGDGCGSSSGDVARNIEHFREGYGTPFKAESKSNTSISKSSDPGRKMHRPQDTPEIRHDTDGERQPCEIMMLRENQTRMASARDTENVVRPDEERRIELPQQQKFRQQQQQQQQRRQEQRGIDGSSPADGGGASYDVMAVGLSSASPSIRLCFIFEFKCSSVH